MSTRRPSSPRRGEAERGRTQAAAAAVGGAAHRLAHRQMPRLTIQRRERAGAAGRQIRAELLVDLLTGTRLPDGKPPRAVKLRGARITGSLDLEAATLTCPLLLQDCYIDEPVILDRQPHRRSGCPAATCRA